MTIRVKFYDIDADTISCDYVHVDKNNLSIFRDEKVFSFPMVDVEEFLVLPHKKRSKSLK